jgi:hypothetical protein
MFLSHVHTQLKDSVSKIVDLAQRRAAAAQRRAAAHPACKEKTDKHALAEQQVTFAQTMLSVLEVLFLVAFFSKSLYRYLVIEVSDFNDKTRARVLQFLDTNFVVIASLMSTLSEAHGHRTHLSNVYARILQGPQPGEVPAAARSPQPSTSKPRPARK